MMVKKTITESGNMQSSRNYPLNVSAISKIGVDNWFNSFKMPINAGEYQKVYRCFFDAYLESMPDENTHDPLYQVCCICYKTYMSLADYFFDCMSYKKCHGEGWSFIGADGEEVAYEDVYREKRGNIRYIPIGHQGVGCRFREHWRKIRLNWGYRSCLESLFPTVFSKNDFYILGCRLDPVVASYIKNRGDHPLSLSPYVFLSKGSRQIADCDAKRVSVFVDAFLGKIFNSYSEYADIIDKNIRENLVKYYIETIKDYNSVSRAISSCGISGELIINPIGNMMLRLFAASWRANGGTVTACSHGNAFAQYHPNDAINGAYSVIDNFIASSSGDMIGIQHQLKRYGSRFPSKAKIQALACSSYEQAFEGQQIHHYKVEKVKKVLVTGFPMDYHYYYGWACLNTLTYCHFEIKLLKVLKENGYYTMYKAHPESSRKSAGVIARYADEYITKDYYSVCSQADCLVFPHVGTTTFGFSLMTQIPMVAFIEDPLGWDSKVFEALKKRCMLLKIGLDSDSRVLFDEKLFLQAVENSPKMLDHAVVREFALK